MLSRRAQVILNSIVGQYIDKAVPVASQSLTHEYGLRVSSATIRNEMARLEEEGYITRPYPSAGSIPLDKGYRHYVESLGTQELPPNDQILINHLFHQVEREIEQWMRLAATLIARWVHNVAIVTTPKPAHCQLKHLELVALHDTLALVIVVFLGARVKQQLLLFDQAVSQSTLSATANKLNTFYAGLTQPQIVAKDIELSPLEQEIEDCLLKMMQDEDERQYEEPYLDGLHFILNQPEFAHGRQRLTLLELAEQRQLLSSILPPVPPSRKVEVVIGRENKADAMHHCSVVISQYGSPGDIMGTVGVIGPTRMPYARTIPTVSYISSLLSELVAELYGQESD